MPATSRSITTAAPAKPSTPTTCRCATSSRRVHCRRLSYIGSEDVQMVRRVAGVLTAVALATVVDLLPIAGAQSPVPAAVEGDFVARDFRFGTGETLPELKLHYRTLGTPRRD